MGFFRTFSYNYYGSFLSPKIIEIDMYLENKYKFLKTYIIYTGSLISKLKIFCQ